MAPSTLRRAIGAVKDKTSIGLAKVGSSASLSDLDVAIVKATRHEEYPGEEKYIREILSFTCYSRSYISACVGTLSRRLTKTRTWTVALKTLVLIQRLLSDGDPAFEQEIFFATRRGTRILNMSDFRDTSRSDSWDFSAFVRTYALYLDERLEFKMLGRRGRRGGFAWEEEGERESQDTPHARVHEMKLEKVFSRIQHLQQLLERFLACRPTGSAKGNRVVIAALYPIMKESWQTYYDLTEVMGVLLDRFVDMDETDCVKVYEIFSRIGKQFEELDSFYSWSRNTGIARSSEYPEVEKITQKKLDIMNDFIREKNIRNRGSSRTVDEPVATSYDEDLNSVKALPPPEGFSDDVAEEDKEMEPCDAKSIHDEDAEVVDAKGVDHEADLLNFGYDAPSVEQHGDDLALALFDGSGNRGHAAWGAYDLGENGEWEKALVESASNLSEPNKLALGGGFDMLLLDGMYQHGATSAQAAAMEYANSGSASSVAVGSAAGSVILALPAPDRADTAAGGDGADPFAASLGVAPPAYVQMSEMETKQKLLRDEQVMWQQYAQGGMQGQVGMEKLRHSNPFHMGTYTHG